MCAASFLKRNVMQHSRKKKTYILRIMSLCQTPAVLVSNPGFQACNFAFCFLDCSKASSAESDPASRNSWKTTCHLRSDLADPLEKGRANQWRLYKSPPIRKILWVQLGSEALKIHEIHFHGVSFSGYLLQQPRGSCSLMVNLSGLPFPGNLIRKGNITSGSVLIILATSIIPSG